MADIEILIRMSETLWNNLNNPNRFNSASDIWDMEISVTNGKVLPKGHGDLIDKNEYFNGNFNDAREFLDRATTIIEADKGDEDEYRN